MAVPPVISKPLLQNLPSTADLPCSDDTPVDNEDQNLLPNLLLLSLIYLSSFTYCPTNFRAEKKIV